MIPMKIKKSVLTFVSACLGLMLLVCSCEKYKTDGESWKSFRGDIVVTSSDGSVFTDPDIRTGVSNSLHGEGLRDVFLKGVKFASGMPVRIDMTIPSVSVDDEGNLTGENIVPWALGGPFEKWTISTFSGRITYTEEGEPDTFEFEMVCGEYPVSYSGRYM